MKYLTSGEVIFETVLSKIILYASHVNNKNNERSRLQATEVQVLRTIVNGTRTDKIRNETIRSQVGVVKLQNKIDAKHLKWLGHLVKKIIY